MIIICQEPQARIEVLAFDRPVLPHAELRRQMAPVILECFFIGLEHSTLILSPHKRTDSDTLRPLRRWGGLVHFDLHAPGMAYKLVACSLKALLCRLIDATGPAEQRDTRIGRGLRNVLVCPYLC